MSKLVASTSHNTPCLHSKASPSLSLGSAEQAGISLHPLFIQSKLQKISHLNSLLSSSFGGVSQILDCPAAGTHRRLCQTGHSLWVTVPAVAWRQLITVARIIIFRSWLHPPFSSEQGTLYSVPVLPVLLSILESMATVGMEAPGNRTVPHSHVCIFLWWRGPSSLIASGLCSALGTPSCNEYNATLPKG